MERRLGFLESLLSDLMLPGAVVVHQMGKVGSESVYASLRGSNLDLPVFHTHFMNPETVRKVTEYYAEKNAPPVDHLIVSRHLYRKFETENRFPWKLVSMVRDPVAREISSFFQNLPLLYPDLYRKMLIFPKSAHEELLDLFLQTGLNGKYYETWFDTEVKEVFGIDVFSTPFSGEKGYGIYKGEKAELLVMRLESLDRTAAIALDEFLGVKSIQLIRKNEGGDKRYARAYTHFIEASVFPDTFINRMYDSRVTHHFYTDEEISRFRSRWSTFRDLPQEDVG